MSVRDAIEDRAGLHVTPWWLAVIGLGAGSILAAWLSRDVQNRLFGVTNFDPLSVAAAAIAIMLIVALSAVAPR